MTAAALRSNFSAHRLAYALAVLAIALVTVVALLESRRADAHVVSETIMVPPARAAALVDATSGETADAVNAIGDDAKLINAAMPFAGGPVRAARPFEIAGNDLDQRRALLCLTQAVYYEAGFEPMAGRRAVAQVVLNRMRHPAYPKSVCGVVYQKNRTPVCQFSFVCDGSLYRQPAAAAWRQAREIAAAALAGYVEQSVGSATHYHADYVAPRWAPMLSKVAKLGAHIFYRWPGAWGLPAAFTGRYIGEPSDPASLRPALRPQSPDLAGDSEADLPAAMAGPPIARAPNDVGGLLDVAKGWTLNIPMPSETGAATRAIAERQHNPPAPVAETKPAGAVPVLASR